MRLVAVVGDLADPSRVALIVAIAMVLLIVVKMLIMTVLAAVVGMLLMGFILTTRMRVLIMLVVILVIVWRQLVPLCFARSARLAGAAQAMQSVRYPRVCGYSSLQITAHRFLCDRRKRRGGGRGGGE